MTYPAFAQSIRSWSARILPLLFAGAVAAGVPATAAAAEIDNAFGAGRGYVPVLGTEPQSDTVAAVVRQADDRFVVLGRRMIGSRGILLLQRYAPDAQLDSGFGDQGTLTIDLPGESLLPRQLTRQENGRLLVAFESATALHIRALQPSGQIDESFGVQGELVLPLAPGVPAGSTGFQVQNSGSMIAILQNGPGPSLGLTLYRFRSEGVADPDFGGSGKRVLANLGAGLTFSGAAAVLTDDRVVIGASAPDASARTLFLLASEGSLDAGFGIGGKASPVALQGMTIKRIAPLASGLFLVAAVGGSGAGQTSTIVRFDPQGRIDTGFAGGTGTLRVEAAGATGVAVAEVFEEVDNYLVVTGTTSAGMLVARYQQRGVPDVGFNAGRGPLLVPEPASAVTQGVATVSFGSTHLVHLGVGVAYGAPPTPATAPSRAFMISTNEGVPDIRYADKGIVSLFGRSLQYGEMARQVMPLADGRIMVLSSTGVGEGLLGTLSRFLADGTPDPAFGNQGRATFPLNGRCEWPLSMAQQPDGRIVLLGTSFNTTDCDTSAMFGKRFAADGLQDFFALAYSGVVLRGRSGAIAVQADGKSVVTGQDDRSLVVARFLSTGLPDPAFAVGGRSLWQRGSGDDVKGGAILVQPDQKVVVAGAMNGTHVVLLRYDASGAADSTFGSGGVVQQAVPGSGFLEVQAMTTTPQGRLLVLARLSVRPLLLQFTASGALDTSFGVGGMVSLALYAGGSQYSPFGLAVQPDGGIVVSGQSTSEATSEFALMRISAAGQADSTFGPNATLLWRPSIFFAAGASGVAKLADGNLLAIGYGLPGAMLARVRVAGITSAAVVEFFNSPLNHYFITADPVEQAAIDAGAAGPGWSRTGGVFRAWTPALGIPSGQTPVCRFYGSNAINPATGQRRGPNSHFYTAQTAECEAVQKDPGWVLEGFAFHTRLPEANGLCVAGTVPVFRAYNNRAQFNDSNHRYTTDFGTYQHMQSLGWAPEGIVFCAAGG